MKSLLVIFFSTFIFTAVKSQVADSTWIWIKAYHRNPVAGQLVRHEGDTLMIQDGYGGVHPFKRHSIKRMYQIDSSQVKKGDFWAYDQSPQRYHWWGTGNVMKKGEWQLRYFVPSGLTLQGGITQRWTSSVTFEPFSLLAGYSIVSFNNRYLISSPKDRYKLSVGLLHLVTIDDLHTEIDTYQVPYLGFNLPVKKGHYSFSAGVGSWGDTQSELHSFIHVGRFWRHLPRWAFYMEGFWYNRPENSDFTRKAAAIGWRYLGMRLQADLTITGFIVDISADDDPDREIIIPVPMVSFNFPLRKRNEVK